MHGDRRLDTRHPGPYAQSAAAFAPLEIGISSAVGRLKKRPKLASGGVLRRGLKYAGLGGLWAESGRLEARGWRVGMRLTVHGSQDRTRVSGLTSMLAMACRHCAQGHPGGRVAVQPVATCIRRRTRLRQRSAAPGCARPLDGGWNAVLGSSDIRLDCARVNREGECARLAERERRTGWNSAGKALHRTPCQGTKP